jgi:hypothetical protein
MTQAIDKKKYEAEQARRKAEAQEGQTRKEQPKKIMTAEEFMKWRAEQKKQESVIDEDVKEQEAKRQKDKKKGVDY